MRFFRKPPPVLDDMTEAHERLLKAALAFKDPVDRYRHVSSIEISLAINIKKSIDIAARKKMKAWEKRMNAIDFIGIGTGFAMNGLPPLYAAVCFSATVAAHFLWFGLHFYNPTYRWLLKRAEKSSETPALKSRKALHKKTLTERLLLENLHTQAILDAAPQLSTIAPEIKQSLQCLFNRVTEQSDDLKKLANGLEKPLITREKKLKLQPRR